MESRLALSRYAYVVTAWLFAAGILIQVFLIGLSFLGGQPSLQTHTGLGHGLAVAPLVMIVAAYTGRLPHPLKLSTWIALVVYILLADVVIFMRGSAPIIAALHPVLAVILFGTVGSLAIRISRLIREAQASALLKTS